MVRFGSVMGLVAVKKGWKRFLEAIRFILAKYGPVASHGDPNREGFRGFELVFYGFELVFRGFELVFRGFELVFRGFELVFRGF